MPPLTKQRKQHYSND